MFTLLRTILVLTVSISQSIASNLHPSIFKLICSSQRLGSDCPVQVECFAVGSHLVGIILIVLKTIKPDPLIFIVTFTKVTALTRLGGLPGFHLINRSSLKVRWLGSLPTINTTTPFRPIDLIRKIVVARRALSQKVGTHGLRLVRRTLVRCMILCQ